MSKKKSSNKKKPSSSAPKKTISTQAKKTITPTAPTRAKASTAVVQQTDLAVGAPNYLWMGIGIVLVITGMLLMLGGAMPSPDVWDADLIYGFRRTVLAPIVILAGLVIEIYAIFKN